MRMERAGSYLKFNMAAGPSYTSYMPSIGTVPQIKYKKLPFYEVIDEVIKPTLLTGTDRRTLPNVPEGSNIL